MSTAPLPGPLPSRRSALVLAVSSAALVALAAGACSPSPPGSVPGVLAGSSGSGSAVAVAPDSPESFGPVPEFQLVDQLGRSVTRDTLLGRPFVLAAIFSRCTGPCPSISANMADLQRRLEGTDVRLVSISVDPEYDSSEVLSDYGAAWGADPERWLFLTGGEEAVESLVREGFWMAVDRVPEGQLPAGEAVTHDTRLVAVDRDGERRGWYDQAEPAEVGRLLARMRFLAKQDPGQLDPGPQPSGD